MTHKDDSTDDRLAKKVYASKKRAALKSAVNSAPPKVLVDVLANQLPARPDLTLDQLFRLRAVVGLLYEQALRSEVTFLSTTSGDNDPEGTPV